jgi:TolB protein
MMKKFIFLVLIASTLSMAIDIGISVITGAGAEEIASKVLKTLEDLAPDYVILHSGTSDEYDLNFEVVFLLTEKEEYRVVWKEGEKEVAIFTRPPNSPFPLKFFLVDSASVPLEKAALLKLKKGDWKRFLRLTYRSSVDEYPSFSPDGRYIVFSSDRIGGTRDVFFIDTIEGKMYPLKIPGSSEYFPSISPDGSTLLFQGSFTGNWAVYTIPIDGNTRNLKRIAGDRRKAAYMPRWINNNSVAYLMDEDDGNFIYIKDTKTNAATKINLPFDYVFSPEFCGDDLYFVGLKGADFGIYILKNGIVSVVENSEYNEHDLDISQDCSKILFVSNRDGIYRLWLKDLESGKISTVTDFIDYDVFYPAFHPNGEMAAISVYEPDMEPDIWLVRLDVSEEATGIHKEGELTPEGTENSTGGLGGH